MKIKILMGLIAISTIANSQTGSFFYRDKSQISINHALGSTMTTQSNEKNPKRPAEGDISEANAKLLTTKSEDKKKQKRQLVEDDVDEINEQLLVSKSEKKKRTKRAARVIEEQFLNIDQYINNSLNFPIKRTYKSENAINYENYLINQELNFMKECSDELKSKGIILIQHSNNHSWISSELSFISELLKAKINKLIAVKINTLLDACQDKDEEQILKYDLQTSIHRARGCLAEALDCINKRKANTEILKKIGIGQIVIDNSELELKIRKNKYKGENIAVSIKKIAEKLDIIIDDM